MVSAMIRFSTMNRCKKTFAELTIDEKNKVSHRGKVLAELSSEFDKVMEWLQRGHARKCRNNPITASLRVTTGLRKSLLLDNPFIPVSDPC